MLQKRAERKVGILAPGFGSYQAALFSFHWVWLVPKKHFDTATVVLPWGGRGVLRALPLLFKAPSALCFPVWKQMELKSFKMLCCNHTVFPPPQIGPQPLKWQPLIVQPEPLGFLGGHFPTKAALQLRCCVLLLISKRLLEISCQYFPPFWLHALPCK